jgi:TusA-related sulfurtransferase
MKDLDVGDELEFIADDQSCVSDLPAWCGITGNELVKLDNTNGVITAVIRRAQ